MNSLNSKEGVSSQSFLIRVIRRIRVIRDPSFSPFPAIRDPGFTLVELLVALAIASILMLGLIAAFQTTQRTSAVGEAREQIYQNARVALDIMGREIKSAYIDHRNRDFVFVSADGLAGRGSSIIEFSPNPPAAGPYIITARGLGNAQTPHGINPTGVDVFKFYADRTFGDTGANPIFTDLTIKALDANTKPLNSLRPAPDLDPGPPDRLDFTCLTGNFPGNSGNESRLAEVRYIVTTETFVDDLDNDHDGNADGTDSNPPTAAGLVGLGDLISKSTQYRDEDFNATTGKIKALSLFQLRRGIGVDTAASDPKPVVVDKNPFSANNMMTANELPVPPNTGLTLGRYPSRDFDDFTTSKNGESIGSYIYDLQFDFYGRIAISLDSNGRPNTWGVGWGNQDVRGEDVGTDANGAAAIQTGTVTVTQGSASVTGLGTAWTAGLVGGTFFIWPASATEFDVTDPASDVYKISAWVSGTSLTLDRAYAGTGGSGLNYRIIEPTQANGILDTGEDLGADGLVNDPLDNSSGIPNNVSDNDGVPDESSVGEGNGRLDSRVMGIWDSRSPDPRNPRRAAELNGGINGVDDDGDGQVDDFTGIYASPEANTTNGIDDDGDGRIDDGPTDPYGRKDDDDNGNAWSLQTNLDGFGTPIDDDQDGFANTSDDEWGVDVAATPEIDDPAGATPAIDETNDLIDNDVGGTDGIADDRFYEPSGKPEGIDEPDEANPDDDTLPKAVRITIAVSDSQQSLDPVVLSTTVWLSTAK